MPNRESISRRFLPRSSNQRLSLFMQITHTPSSILEMGESDMAVGGGGSELEDPVASTVA